MSDWIECPQCPAEAKARAEVLRQEANEAYGKVSQTDWQVLHDKAVEAEAFKPGITVREYCEVGIRGGKFMVSYGAHCEKCSFSFEYDYRDDNIVKVPGSA